MPLSNTCQFTERDRRVTATSFQFPPIFLLLHSPLDRPRREISLSSSANSISYACYMQICRYCRLSVFAFDLYTTIKFLSAVKHCLSAIFLLFFCVVAPQSGLDICGRRNETNWLKKCRVTRCDTVQILADTAVLKLAHPHP